MIHEQSCFDIHSIRTGHSTSPCVRARLVVRIATVNECDNNHYNAEPTKVTFNSGCVRFMWTRCLRWSTTFYILVAAIGRRAIHNAVSVEMAPNAETVILRIATHHFGTRRTFCEMTKLHFRFVQFAVRLGACLNKI